MSARSRSRSRLAYPHPRLLRLASAVLIVKWLVGVAALTGLVIGIATGDRGWTLVALACLAAFAVLIGLGLALGNELPCNVCGQPPLIDKRCRKHPRARRFLGLSYPLTVAFTSLFAGRFRCVYCGERIPLGKSRAAAAGKDEEAASLSGDRAAE